MLSNRSKNQVRSRNPSTDNNDKKQIKFSDDKKSVMTEKEIEDVKM